MKANGFFHACGDNPSFFDAQCPSFFDIDIVDHGNHNNAMHITYKGDYAIKTILDLAEHFGESPVTIQTLATRADIPIKFLEQILLTLKRGELVMSKRGKDGGYQLARHPSRISLGEVLRFIDECIKDRWPASTRTTRGAARWEAACCATYGTGRGFDRSDRGFGDVRKAGGRESEHPKLQRLPDLNGPHGPTL